MPEEASPTAYAAAVDSTIVSTWSWRAVGPPVAVAVSALAAVVTIGLRDPHAAGNYPPCPSIALFGAYCPGCGSMRAVHELAHGDLAGVMSRNVLVPVGLLLLAWSWVAWIDRRLGRAQVPTLRPPVPVLYGSIVVLVFFAVLRNLPVPPFSGLAP